jgi:hypothetical protein
MNPLTPWQNFYVILGSAAAGLTGLQFVAIALIADMSMKPGEVETGSEAFATPAVVHFVAVLLFAATMVMPWHSLATASHLWAIGGLSGVAYILLIAWRMRKTTYKPVFEDWFFRVLIPLCAYVGLATAAAFVPSHTRRSLFALAAAMLLLLTIAIHNAWDNVTYLVFMRRHQATKKH